jgi:ADP-heptose:LPS heptosyltransferase
MFYLKKPLSVCLYFLKLPFKRWTYELIDQLVLHFVRPGKAGGVLIFRLDLLGDYLMSRPFFRSIRTGVAFEGREFCFAGNQMLEQLAPAMDADVFDAYIWIDRARFINSIGYRFRMLSEIRRRGFEVFIQPAHTRQYWLESVVRVSGAKDRITPYPVGNYMSDMEQSLADSWYSRILPTSAQPQFEFFRNRRFFAQLAPKAALVFTLKENWFDQQQKRQNLILVAPGASTEERRWPEDRFVKLLDELAVVYPSFAFGLTGAGSEQDFCSRIADQCVVARPEVFAGRLSLLETMVLLSSARLLVANESGPVHMAATTGTACVCISNGNHFGRWNPYPVELTSSILTCYPDAFYPLELHHGSLIENYHQRSWISADQVTFDRVKQACIFLLDAENEEKKPRADSE